MPRGWKLFWTVIGSVAAVAAVVIALLEVNSGTSPKSGSSPLAASSRVPHPSASASPRPSKSDPVVIPRTSGRSPFSYIADLSSTSKLAELIYPGPVTIYGAIYPKSISFYCDDGDLPTFPAVYRLKSNARRFEATVGVEAKWPAHYLAGISVVGDGRTLRSFNVGVLKPKTIDVNVTGVHVLTLECFTPGMTSTAEGWNVEVSWGNARVTEAH
jgi:hypothetical protein